MTWLDRDPHDTDRGYFLTLGIVFVLGVLLMGAGIVTALTAPSSASYVLQNAENRAEGGVIFGALLILVAVGGLGYRWVKGPQAPGRHTRDGADDTMGLRGRPPFKEEE